MKGCNNQNAQNNDKKRMHEMRCLHWSVEYEVLRDKHNELNEQLEMQITNCIIKICTEQDECIQMHRTYVWSLMHGENVKQDAQNRMHSTRCLEKNRTKYKE